MTKEQQVELFNLIHNIVNLHKERQCVLQIDIENLADLLDEIEGE